MLSIKLIVAVLIFCTTSYAGAEQSVQAYSEGSDCRCKCILTTKDGGPCEESRDERLRKTIYLVETISSGTDCRCSCQTPPPGGCELTSSLHDHTRSHRSKEFNLRFDPNHMHEIDLVELHSSISNMVSAMVKLERAVSKKSSKSDLEVLRQNVNKVVADLRSTNGSYDDLLKDLDLDIREDAKENNSDDEANIIELGSAVPSLKTLDLSQGHKAIDAKQHNIESIGVAPRHILGATKPTNFTTTSQHRVEGARMLENTTKQSQAGTEESSPPPTTSVAISTTQEEIQPLQSQTSLTRSQTGFSIIPTNSFSWLETATKPAESVAITSARRNPPVEPRVVFVPYRSKGRQLKVDDTASRRVKTQEYDYNYDGFDVGGESKITENPTAKVDAATKPAISLVSNTTLAATTTTTNKGEDSYADHLREYEYEYEYDDDITIPPTTTTTTTKATTPKKDPCGTLFSLSRPRIVSHFGRREGAWMRDPVRSKTDPMRDKRIYIANFYYGSNLIEFDGVEGVRELRYRNSYNLPHKWIGTGHIVYNGSFYYNRAFSRTLIKYNLRFRFVSAWSRLANAAYDPTTPLTWKGHSMVHMAADEDGLWVIFPVRDPFDPYAELTYVINKINPVDLRIIETFKSKIRQTVSHVFMICGVLYSTDRYNSRRARVTHAFDTRTLGQRSFYLGFENLFSYNVQFLYNPNERKIYAWDNGRQMEYRVSLMY